MAVPGPIAVHLELAEEFLNVEALGPYSSALWRATNGAVECGLISRQGEPLSEDGQTANCVIRELCRKGGELFFGWTPEFIRRLEQNARY